MELLDGLAAVQGVDPVHVSCSRLLMMPMHRVLCVCCMLFYVLYIYICACSRIRGISFPLGAERYAVCLGTFPIVAWERSRLSAWDRFLFAHGGLSPPGLGAQLLVLARPSQEGSIFLLCDAQSHVGRRLVFALSALVRVVGSWPVGGVA